jgi:predicted ArsR family transcriptional regulator
MRGRKPKEESRAAEFRQTLVAWRQIPATARLSLRALARQLGTSHQLLKHHLDGLEKWRYMERYRNANEEADQIVARAILEGRPMTQWEEQQRNACTIAALRAKAGSVLLDELANLKQDARRSPLNRHQIKMLRVLARHSPEARELLQSEESRAQPSVRAPARTLGGGVPQNARA